MTGLVNIPFRKQYFLKPMNLVPAGYFMVAFVGLQNYIQPGSMNVMLGLLAVIFACKTDPAKKSYRYGWLTFAMFLLCFFMPVKTLLFFSIGFGLLFFTESVYGKTGLPAFFVVVFTSPVFQYIGNVFSFPIRLWLTRFAGSIFNLLGSGVTVKGNMIMHNGNEFSVDPACMGLNMITASLLAGIMIAGIYEAKYKKKMKGYSVVLYLAIIFLLNVFSNLSRIILLVQFNIQPDSFSHDIVGLACLFVYVLLPAVWLAVFFVKRSGDMKDTASVAYPVSKQPIIIHLLFLISAFLLSLKVAGADTFSRFKIPGAKEVPGFVIGSPTPGIVKLDRAEVLIYIKYIRGFYDTEHNPMICWTGAGYKFLNVAVEKIGGRSVFTGTISNEKDNFYSAWWYDNGKKHTTSQLEWRWDLLTGSDHYVLVNISCPSRKKLESEIQEIINQKTLSPFFKYTSE
jgi:exosortase N